MVVPTARNARGTALTLAVLLACGDDASGSGTASPSAGSSVTSTSAGPGATGTVTTPGTTGESDASGGSTGASTTTASASEGDTDASKFDLGDHGDLQLDDPVPTIPATCEEAEDGDTSVGCRFYTIDFKNNVDLIQFAVAVSNVQDAADASVLLERRVDGVWETVSGPVTVAALELHEFLIDDFHIEDTGVHVGGAYRVTADIPIIAYQFNPVDGATSYLSDASMLYPVSAWDHRNQVVNWTDSGPAANPFVGFTVAEDGTLVTFTPAVATEAGPGVPATDAGVSIVLELNEGDAVTIMPVDKNADLSGTTVETDPDQPVAVFSGHGCGTIPGDSCCCDHLEEQLSGVGRWGQNFVAAHMPIREVAAPEATLWQVYASEDDTTVEFTADPALTGLPGPSVELDRGEVVNMFVSAPVGVEADFRIHADRPVAVVGYMISAWNLSMELWNFGDPAMIQFPPVEQFMTRYVVLVPGTWVHDFLILTRPAGAALTDNGAPIPDMYFEPVADGAWEVARYPAADGLHVLESDDERFGVVVFGWDDYDSYGYVGGTATSTINPPG